MYIYCIYIYIYVFIYWSKPSLHHDWSHTVVHVISRVIVSQPCLMYILCPCHRCQGTFSVIPSSGHQKCPGRNPTYHVVCIYDHIMWVKQCHVYHPHHHKFIGAINLPFPVILVIYFKIYHCFTHMKHPISHDGPHDIPGFAG